MDPGDHETLLLSGGGVKAIAYIGALRALIELGRIQSVHEFITVSAGSIVGLMHIVGYTPEEMETEIMEMDTRKLLHIKITHFLYKYGIDSGNGVLRWIRGLLIRKGFSENLTFRELHQRTGKCLRVLATNLCTRELVSFSHIESPGLSVVKAVRMSISIPFMYTVCKYKGDMYVDGGLINNYPRDLCKSGERFLGLRLMPSMQKRSITDITSYIYSVIRCVINSDTGSTSDTISIYTDAGTLNFDLSRDTKVSLIQQGYAAVRDFFT
ncbi:MAG: hypothetical protein EBU90_11725 [Proteobacteria bacterium]|nr:hypothetical protein [Pseudomonadota bacterium]NBP14514.1 hypothetical protein [bacterium]